MLNFGNDVLVVCAGGGEWYETFTLTNSKTFLMTKSLSGKIQKRFWKQNCGHILKWLNNRCISFVCGG